MLLLSGLLPGCPLSDNYFVETSPGAGGSQGGAGGSNLGGGAPPSGGRNGRGGMGVSGSGMAGDTSCADQVERCDGVTNDCDEEIDEDSACPEGCSATNYDGHAYVLCVVANASDGFGADDASAQCAEIGRDFGPNVSVDLASIESKAENDVLKRWIQDTVSGSAVVWIGASDRDEENTWVWGRGAGAEQFFVGDSSGGGTPYMDRFNDWAPGSPRSLNGEDQDCGCFDTGLSLHWDDRGCDSVERGFICEEHPLESGSAGSGGTSLVGSAGQGIGGGSAGRIGRGG